MNSLSLCHYYQDLQSMYSVDKIHFNANIRSENIPPVTVHDSVTPKMHHFLTVLMVNTKHKIS